MDELNIEELNAADRKEAAWYLLNYAKTAREYEEVKLEALAPLKDENASIRGGPGRPTESAALRSMRYDFENPVWYWLKAVKIVERGLGDKKRLFLAVRREAENKKIHVFARGRRAWIVYTQKRFEEATDGVQPGIRLSERTIRAWCREIVNRVVETRLRLQIKYSVAVN